MPGAVIKRRARELRALGERKTAAFRQSQIGRILRVLTLRQDENDQTATPALSTNFMRIHVAGAFPSNQWLDVRPVGSEGTSLTGQTVEVDLKPSSLPVT